MTAREQMSADLADAQPPFILSDEVEAVAAKVMTDHDAAFGWIARDFKVAYLLKLGDKPSPDDEIDTIAKCNKAPDLWSTLAGYDFAIWVKDCYWRLYPKAAQEALIAHELGHIDATDAEKPKIRKHDLTAFGQEAAWYGPWNQGLALIERSLASFRAERVAAQESVETAVEGLDGTTFRVGDNVAHITSHKRKRSE